ncbi:TetR family transcriptional regulator C-terminal domain-containing protein [uncultured Methylobacterium sp.]|uniref:TetR family transcriptional regulator C-terminal domain-containing protein n=1 Tax=uncultured Methylobacterium sp. TaxID=157278 RepID=UPI0035CA739D
MSSRTTAARAAKARIRDTAQVRILDAAAEVFARSSLSGATMAEIAGEAGMPPATVHYYFRSKAALYDAVLDRMLESWLSELDQIDASGHPAEALAAYIVAKMRVSHSYPAASRIVAGEVLRGGTKLKSFLVEQFAPHLRTKLDLVDAWKRDSLVRPVDPMRLFFLIWASTEFYANYASEIVALEGEDAMTGDSLEKAARGLVDLILYGALPQASG